MKGISRAMERIRKTVERMAAADYPVLITGESGVGKELAARAIHEASARSRGPYLAVNCACIPDALAESELFGVARGAFTGADADRPGLFEAARQGTLFLDEIEALSPGGQDRLLRVIESGTFRRLGEMIQRTTDARVIAAGNRPLLEMVREGSFRSDLYYRLNVLALEVPPLRERLEDLEFLAEEFLQRVHEETGMERKALSAEALAHLKSYPWPGNIRELENAIRRAVVLGAREVLTPEDFGFLHAPGPGDGSIREFARAAVAGRTGTLDQVARRLGISRKTLWTWRKSWAAAQ
jgi:DNA-binding NtrC family response regulator